MTTNLNLLIACREYGLSSETWMRRQSSYFEYIDSDYLCWENNKNDNLDGNELGYPFDDNDGVGLFSRWIKRVKRVPKGNLMAPARTESATIKKLISKGKRPDAILCHYGHVALRMLPIAQDLGIPLIAHFHGNDISSSLRNKYYRYSLKKCLNQFAACVAVGTKQVEILKELGVSDEKIHLIPCGAPPNLFTPKDQYREKPCKFITVSRLVPWKGVDIALNAFTKTWKSIPDVELHIVGDGQSRPMIELLRENSPAKENIFIHGEKNDEQIKQMLRDSDVFVQHSLDYKTGWFEGFGVSITEASLTGLPVVATGSGGIMDQIRHGYNGLLVEQNSVDSTHQAMLELAQSNSKRQELGKNGRNRAVEEFDSKKLAAKLENVIQNAVKS